MSGAVRGTSGAQGGGGLAVGGGAAASRGAPADGASFGGVLGAAMSAPHGATDGNGKGKGADAGSGKNSGGQTAAAEPIDVVAGLVQDGTAAAGAGSATPAVSGAAVSPVVTGRTARNGKKAPANAALAMPLSAAQAAIAAAASVTAPASNMSPTAPAPTSAATGTPPTAAPAGAGTPKAAIAAPTLSRQPTLIAGTVPAPANHELAGPEDGTGPREPDGIDPASATVGRPAAMAASGLGISPSANAALPNSANAALPNTAPANATDTTAAAVSGSTDRSSPSPIVPISTANTTTSGATVVFATLAAGERDSGHGTPTTGGDARPVAATSLAPAASGGMITSAPSAAAPAAPSPGPAAGAVGVVAADGSSQPLANALGSQVLAMVATGRNQVTIHLAPPDLGALTVRVEVQSRDVSAWFASPQPQVQQAVNDALAQLHGALGGAGLNLAGAWVGADASGGNGRPTAAPAPLRRAAPVAGVADATAADNAASAEGLSVYA